MQFLGRNGQGGTFGNYLLGNYVRRTSVLATRGDDVRLWVWRAQPGLQRFPPALRATQFDIEREPEFGEKRLNIH